jgi:hypothetical protein
MSLVRPGRLCAPQQCLHRSQPARVRARPTFIPDTLTGKGVIPLATQSSASGSWSLSVSSS